MRQDMIIARSTLRGLLDANEITADLYIRVHAKNLILGREDAIGPDEKVERDDRVRLTRLAGTSYGLSVKRHTGRWERTPFLGSLPEMVETISTLMQHLVAPY